MVFGAHLTPCSLPAAASNSTVRQCLFATGGTSAEHSRSESSFGCFATILGKVLHSPEAPKAECCRLLAGRVAELPQSQAPHKPYRFWLPNQRLSFLSDSRSHHSQETQLSSQGGEPLDRGCVAHAPLVGLPGPLLRCGQHTCPPWARGSGLISGSFAFCTNEGLPDERGFDNL